MSRFGFFNPENASYYARRGRFKSRGPRKSLHFSMKDVADACGISLSTLYRRLKGKSLLRCSLTELVEFIRKYQDGRFS